MAQTTLTALFATYDQAHQAVRSLEESGIPSDEITLLANNIDEAISALGLTGPARAKRYRISYHLPAVARVDVAAVCWRTVDGAIACRIHDPAGRELTSVMVDLATP